MATHSEVRQFYGAVNASKSLPERAKLPPAPKVSQTPIGMAAGAAEVVRATFGIETAHQRAVKAHAEAIRQWRETCRELRQQDAKDWEQMKARSAAAPLAERRRTKQRQTTPDSQATPLPKAAARASAGPPRLF